MMTAQIALRSAIAAAVVLASQAAVAAQFVVGQVAPLSGMEASQGLAYSAGMQLAFNAANKAGGVNGHTFKLVRADDGGRPEDTVPAARKLLAEEKPHVLAGFFGGRNVASLVQAGILEQERIPLVGYRIAEVRPETALLYSVRAGLADEIGKLTEHLATIGITRLALFHEEGPAAPALLAALDAAAAKSKATVLVRAGYPAGTARVGEAVDKLAKVTPQAIIMVSTGAAAAAFIEQYRQAGGTAQLFANSLADIEQMSKRLAEEQMQGVAIAQVTPNPYKITTRIAKEFNDAVRDAGKVDVPVSYAMIEGYIAGRVLVEVVRKQGARLSREGTIAALESMDLNLGGYHVKFEPGKRTGSRFVELSIVSGSGKIRQ